MFCTQCGKEQRDDARFCFACGAAIPVTRKAMESDNFDETVDSFAQRESQHEEADVGAAAVQIERRLPDDQSAQTITEGSRQSQKLHPWRRYFARLIDVIVFGSAGAFVTGFAGYSMFSEATMDAFFENSAAMILLAYGVSILVESSLVSWRGTTLGKGIFGISVRHSSGRLLSFNETFGRCMARYVRAEGLGIPIFALIAQTIAYQRLTSEGATRYDQARDIAVIHTEWSRLRAVTAFLSVLFVFFLYAGLIALAQVP